MFKDLMARFGHGAAKVDLVLNRNQFVLGDVVEGKLVIQGGAVEQQINKIDVRLMVTIQSHERHMTYQVTSIPFYQSFIIHPGERKEFPFQYQLPNNLLLSGNYVTYFFKTELDIIGGVDQNDYDYIQVLPPHSLQQILFALNELGFRETHDSRKFDGHVQEFEFFPTSYYSGQVKELEFVAFLLPDGVRMLLELEVYSFGHEHEIKRDVFISNIQIPSIPELAAHLKHIFDEMIQHSHISYHSHEYHYGHYPHESYYGHYPHEYHYEHGHHGYHGHHLGSGLASAIGGFVTGAISGMVLSEMLDDDDNNNNNHHNNNNNNNDDDGGFLDDLFGGDDGGFFDDGNGDDWF
jgi:sporulation-control protein